MSTLQPLQDPYECPDCGLSSTHCTKGGIKVLHPLLPKPTEPKWVRCILLGVDNKYILCAYCPSGLFRRLSGFRDWYCLGCGAKPIRHVFASINTENRPSVGGSK